MTEPGDPSAYTFSPVVNVAQERVIADWTVMAGASAASSPRLAPI